MNPMTGNTVSIWVASLDIWPLVVVLVLNLMFRRYGSAGGYKRMASLFQAIMIFLITTAASAVAAKNLMDLYFYSAVVVIFAVSVILRKKIFPYRRTCVECDAKLDIETIYFRDPNLCTSCRKAAEAREEAKAAGEKAGATGEEIETTGTTEAGSSKDSWPGTGSTDTDTDTRDE